jgi:hypothetical protein
MIFLKGDILIEARLSNKYFSVAADPMNKIIDIINSVLKLHLFKLFFKGTLTNSLIY